MKDRDTKDGYLYSYTHLYKQRRMYARIPKKNKHNLMYTLSPTTYTYAYTHTHTDTYSLTNTRTHTPVHTRIHTRTQRHIDHLECVSVQEPSGDEIAPPRRLSGVTLGPAHATPTVLKPRPRCFDHTLPSHSLPEFHKDAFTMRGNPVVVQMAFRFCYVWIKAKSVSAEEIIIF